MIGLADPGWNGSCVENIENLPKYDIDNLQIAFDGRYRIEELLDILEEAILDSEARMG
jgi:hypothetical protein